MLLGQLDPGLHGDGVVGHVFMEESNLVGVLCFFMVEFNQFVVGGDRSLGYSGGRGSVWCWRGLGDGGYGLRLLGVKYGMGRKWWGGGRLE